MHAKDKYLNQCIMDSKVTLCKRKKAENREERRRKNASKNCSNLDFEISLCIHFRIIMLKLMAIEWKKFIKKITNFFIKISVGWWFVFESALCFLYIFCGWAGEIVLNWTIPWCDKSFFLRRNFIAILFLLVFATNWTSVYAINEKHKWKLLNPVIHCL